MRATICVDVNSPDERAAVDAWFERWRPELTVVSEDKGCGCCVNIWDIDGSPAAVDAIPAAARSSSEWANGS